MSSIFRCFIKAQSHNMNYLWRELNMFRERSSEVYYCRLPTRHLILFLRWTRSFSALSTLPSSNCSQQKFVQQQSKTRKLQIVRNELCWCSSVSRFLNFLNTSRTHLQTALNLEQPAGKSAFSLNPPTLLNQLSSRNFQTKKAFKLIW